MICSTCNREVILAVDPAGKEVALDAHFPVYHVVKRWNLLKTEPGFLCGPIDVDQRGERIAAIEHSLVCGRTR